MRKCRWRKSHSKIEAADEFGLAMQRKGSLRACFYCIRDSEENQIWKSETSEVVEWAASKNGETCNWRLFIKLLPTREYWRKMVFSRVEIWWNVGSKNGETCDREQPADLFTQHTDKFVIDDDDMDSNTVTESDLSWKSRWFLQRVNVRVRKMQGRPSGDEMQDIEEHSEFWWMFMSSTLRASLSKKNNSVTLHSI